MAKYVCYYDESGWDSWVEVMNLQNARADYKITVYDREGSQRWQDVRTLTNFATERIRIGDEIPNTGSKEGLVIVEPVTQGHEFPVVLTIRAEGEDQKKNRFIPFIRVP